MTPLSLTLRGFLGIQAGQGLEEITIDLTDHEGLVALRGANGAGKSTIMDNLHPYRLMPSRASSYSPKAFSFYDHVGAEGSKTLEWEHNGRRYKSELLFRQTGKSRKTEAYLFCEGHDGWSPAVTPDGTTSDGKTDTYDRCVEYLLGAPELFFTAVFSAQGRRSLSDYSNGDIKAFMADLLGLEHIRELGVKAREVVKAIRAELGRGHDELGRLEEKEADRDQCRRVAGEMSVHIANLEKERDDARLEQEQAQQRVAEERARVEAAKGDGERREELEEKRRDILQRRDEVMVAANDEREEARRVDRQAVQREEATIAENDSAAIRHRARIKEQHGILEQRGEIEQAATAVSSLSAAVEEQRLRVDEQRERLEALGRLNAERHELVGTLGTIRQAGEHLAHQCEAAKERGRLTGEVPCTGTDYQGQCKLLHEAVFALEGLPAMEEQREEKRGEFRKTNDRLLELEQAIEDMGDVRGHLAQAEQNLQDAERALHNAESLAAKAPMLEQANRIIQESESEIQRLESDTAARRQEIDRLAHVLAVSIQRSHDREHEALESLLSEEGAVCRELASIKPVDTQPLTEAEIAAQEARRRVDGLDDGITTQRERVAALRAEADSLERDIQHITDIRERVERLTGRLPAWELLTKALGNDGLIAMEIDTAGPELARLTNELLVSCYGPRFTVRIETQRDKRDGGTAETFDITVFDGEAGGEPKSVSLMSGGERIWINEALTRAIALHLANREGRRYGTLFTDETDGPLDPERKEMFVRMKRRVLELGGYGREFFISHTPEVVGMADAVIEL